MNDDNPAPKPTHLLVPRTLVKEAAIIAALVFGNDAHAHGNREMAKRIMGELDKILEGRK